MIVIENIEQFKTEIAPSLEGYELSYNFFKEGDFGSLNQVEFKSNKIGGNIDFWGLGWLGVFIWSYENERELLNVLFEPTEISGKEQVFNKLIEILKQ